MTIARTPLVTLLALMTLLPPSFAADPIDFKGRSIDVEAYLRGFPYTSPFVDLRSGKLFYKKKGKTDELMMQDFDPASKEKADLAKGKVISPRDFSKRKSLGKEAYFLEMPEQGHGYKGVEPLTRYYRAVFEFLGKIR